MNHKPVETPADKVFDVTTVQAGDIIYYLNREGTDIILDKGTVKSENLYTDGVTVHGDGWKQYVGKWFITKVERNGALIFFR